MHWPVWAWPLFHCQGYMMRKPFTLRKYFSISRSFMGAVGFNCILKSIASISDKNRKNNPEMLQSRGYGCNLPPSRGLSLYVVAPGEILSVSQCQGWTLEKAIKLLMMILIWPLKPQESTRTTIMKLGESLHVSRLTPVALALASSCYVLHINKNSIQVLSF